ncbi:MAG TPA: FAD:protein FMN transferase, partial [Lacipirellulaceae bacterium]|nr:FAD:protein FMN transferase [Lacipirellulaceae bacterium]
MAALLGPWIAAAGAALAAPVEPAAPAEAIALHGRTMGTTYNVRYWHRGTTPAPVSGPELQRRIDALLREFDLQMSTWRSDSEVARFNAAPPNEWFEVSPATAAVVLRALELHRQTEGASDVTIGPVHRLWGFGAGARETAGAEIPIPSDHALAEARARVGAKHLQARSEPPALRKDRAGIEIDLSSLAAGYAVDLIVELLRGAEVHDAMVELGGEVRAIGSRRDGKAWRIGIRSPPSAGPAIVEVVPLSDLALATSGDYHNVRTVGGARVAHIIDPRTGRPLPYGGLSVTVVAPTCFQADGVATALCVMGLERGLAWCTEQNVAALF